MASVGSNPPQDDVSLVMVLMDTNPFFWGGQSPPLNFAQFLQHVLAFFNSILLLHQMNQLVVIGTGMNSCELIYDSSNPEYKKNKGIKGVQEHVIPSIIIVQQLEDFMKRDQALCKDNNAAMNGHSLLSGSLSMALCYIQKILRGGPSHPQPRILCLQGSPDGPQQYVAVMNAIFSAQRSMVPIDSCIVGNQHSAFLQQASHITGGIYLKPQQPEGLFQFLAMVFVTDLHSRRFLQLPRPTGVDFRASCHAGVFAIRRPLIWDTSAQFVFLSSVDLPRSVLHASQPLIKSLYQVKRSNNGVDLLQLDIKVVLNLFSLKHVILRF